VSRLGPFELDTIVVGDWLDIMRQMPNGCVDLIVADPPYGIGYSSSRKTRPDGSPRKKCASFGPDEYDDRWIVEASRLLTDSGALYLFTRWDVLHRWAAAIKDSGLLLTQRLVWNKCHWKMGDLRYYGSQLEDILFARQNGHELRWRKRSGNLWSSSSSAYLPEGQWDHPTQKAQIIIERIVHLSSDRGQVVADFHVGSGTTAVAAKKLGRHFFGCDINPEYVEMARERVAKVDGIQLEMSL